MLYAAIGVAVVAWARAMAAGSARITTAEQFSWELERLCALALQANPTVLEVLWSPLVETITADGQQLLAVRRVFQSRRVADTYGSYARDQLDRVAARRERTGEINHKQAMHMMLLLHAGAHVLRTGEILIDVRHLRDRLLAVRRGELPWHAVASCASDLLADLADAAATTRLPGPAGPRRRRSATHRRTGKEPAVTTEVPHWAAEAARALPRPRSWSSPPRYTPSSRPWLQR